MLICAMLLLAKPIDASLFFVLMCMEGFAESFVATTLILEWWDDPRR